MNPSGVAPIVERFFQRISWVILLAAVPYPKLYLGRFHYSPVEHYPLRRCCNAIMALVESREF